MSEQLDRGGSGGAALAALVLGVVAVLTFPFGGFVIGVMAALVGNGVRKRAVAGQGVPYRDLKRAAWGAMLGLAAIVLNILSAIVMVLLSLSGPPPR